MGWYAQIVGWGKYIPEKVITNDELESMVDTSDGWIRTRTGISQRHIAGPREVTSTLATKAARAALQVAKLSPNSLDLIIVATISPDHIFPATACRVQDALGASRAGAFDLNAGCAGFVYALDVASHLIISGAYENVLVIGAEVMSRLIDWTDRGTCVLFGDGAGAILLQASGTPGGVIYCGLGADGSGADLLMVPAGGSFIPTSASSVAQGQHFIHMDGPEIYRFATRIVAKSTREAIRKANLTPEDIELLIVHQANHRIIESAAKALRFPMEKIFINLDRYGNTSSASIPIALCEAIEEKRIRPGDHIVLTGFGAGLTWASAVIEWSVPVPVAPPARPKRLLVRIRYRMAPLKSFLHRFLRKLDALLSAVAEWVGKSGRR